jgi:hypothetical protein
MFKYIAASILGVACINLHAMETKGQVTLLDGKEWSTGGASGSFQEVPIKHKAKNHSVQAYAIAVDGLGKKKTNVIARGEHSFYVYNDSGNELMCRYEFSLCLDRDSCMYKLQNFKLGKEAEMQNETFSNTTKWLDNAGVYGSIAETVIACGQQTMSRHEGRIEVN